MPQVMVHWPMPGKHVAAYLALEDAATIFWPSLECRVLLSLAGVGAEWESKSIRQRSSCLCADASPVVHESFLVFAGLWPAACSIVTAQ